MNEQEIIEFMDLKSIQNRKVCCYSISAKNMTNLDITMKWLNELSKIKR